MTHLTESDIGEIRVMYKQAKDPGQQIGILADLYLCTRKEIKQVLDLPIVERRYIRWTPQMDKQLLKLKSEGRKNREIAELMGITEASAQGRTRVLRAKARKTAHSV